jgi:rare lipoprotein A
VFHLHRFHWRRKRAALALLPATAVMAMSGIAAAQTVTPPAPAQPGAEVSGGKVDSKVKLRVERHVMAGDKVNMRGRVSPGGKRRVVITVGGRKLKTVSKANGEFSVRWTARGPGVYKAKAVVRGTEHAKRARSRTGQVNAYRSSHASYYGPGLYGNGTACGGTLTPSTVGVANKSLPCGTKVTFRYRGRTVTAKVIDRGPYAAGREWDLTAALKAKLGFGSTGRVLSTR